MRSVLLHRTLGSAFGLEDRGKRSSLKRSTPQARCSSSKAILDQKRNYERD
jgi:hypothetical protein